MKKLIVGGALLIGGWLISGPIQAHLAGTDSDQSHFAVTAPVPVPVEMSANSVVEVSLRVHGGRLVVPVETAAGEVLTFLLATGIPTTLLSESGAARLGAASELTLGGLAVSLEGHQVLPDGDLTVEGMIFDGILGPSMLSQFDILLDAPNKRLLLKAPGREVAWEGVALSEPVRLILLHGVVMSFDVTLNGTRFPGTLDLGSPTLVINEGAREALSLEREGLAALGLGDTDLTDLGYVVRDTEILRRFDPQGNGFVIVGALVAHDCAISLSWAHQEMRTCVR